MPEGNSVEINDDEILEEIEQIPEDELKPLPNPQGDPAVDPDTVGNIDDVVEDMISGEQPDLHPIIDKSLVNDPAQLVQLNIQPGQPLQKALENPAENDELVQSVRDEQPPVSVLNTVMQEIAEEVAHIKAWRANTWDGNVDVSEQSYKRVRMLKSLVETLIEKEKIKSQKNISKIDFHSENFQKVLKYFLEVIQKTFTKVKIPKQFEDIFFTQLAKDFDGFEKKATKIYHGKK